MLRLPFEHQLDLILEARFTDVDKEEIDAIINTLETYRDADFGTLPGGVCAGSHYLGNVRQAVASLRNYGRTPDEIAADERERQRQAQERAEFDSKIDRLKALCKQVESRFPRFFQALSKHFQFVQPNGKLVSYEYDTRITARTLVDLIKFFRRPEYQELANKVQELRDFGFNIFGKLLNTDGGKFRTRYSYITDVTFAYEGPWATLEHSHTRTLGGRRRVKTGVKTVFVENVEDAGGATVHVACTAKKVYQNIETHVQKIEVENIGLGHIGEIIDTIDIVAHATQGIALITDIHLMGEDVVEYVVEVSGKSENRPTLGVLGGGRTLNISSSEVRSVHDVMKKIYEQARGYRGYARKRTELEESLMRA